MRNLTCIICPIGCPLKVDDSNADLSVTGNSCPRGVSYAREEIISPKRTVTATCGIKGEAGSTRRVPVKTVSPCRREKISAMLSDIYKLKVTLPVKTGDVLISNWNGEGIDVAAARTIVFKEGK